MDLKNFFDINKLKSILTGKNSDVPPSSDQTENLDTEDKVDAEISAIEEDEKKDSSSQESFLAKNKLLVRGVMILVAAYLVVDQFFLTPQPNESVAPAENAKAPKTVQEEVVEATPLPPLDSASGSFTDSSLSPKDETLNLSQTAESVSSTAASAVKEIPIEPTPIPEPTLLTEETLKSESTPIAKIESTPVPENESTPIPEKEITPEPTRIAPSKIGEGKFAEEKKNDLSSKLNEMVTPTETPKPQKMEVKEYVPPPNYENIGRGLVYNCKSRHWACVDKESFLQCKQNEIWQKSIKKNPECSARNVYSSIDDCKIIQQHNINTTLKADFCIND